MQGHIRRERAEKTAGKTAGSFTWERRGAWFEFGLAQQNITNDARFAEHNE